MVADVCGATWIGSAGDEWNGCCEIITLVMETGYEQWFTASSGRLCVPKPSGVAPKSNVVPGETSSTHGGSSRPLAAIGTRVSGFKPSFEAITSVARDVPAWVGRNEKWTVACPPGSPISIGVPVSSDQAGSSE